MAYLMFRGGEVAGGWPGFPGTVPLGELNWDGWQAMRPWGRSSSFPVIVMALIHGRACVER